MDELETNTPQGSLTIFRRRIHGGIINALVTPNDNQWFFQQFPTRELAEDFALQYNLILRNEDVQDAIPSPDNDE